MATAGQRQVPLWKTVYAVSFHRMSGKRKAQRSSNIRLNRSRVGAVTTSATDLAYADDIALLGDSFEAVQDALEGVERYAAAVGLKLSEES